MPDVTPDEFAEALGADVVIPLREPGSALSAPEALALRDWFDERQRTLREQDDQP